jgi:hypothetical protein
MDKAIILFAQVTAYLEGKKTYIAGLISIACGIYLNNPEMVATGVLAITLRAGISKQ